MSTDMISMVYASFIFTTSRHDTLVKYQIFRDSHIDVK